MVCGLKLIIPNTDHYITGVIFISFFFYINSKENDSRAKLKNKTQRRRLTTAPLTPNRNTRGRNKKIKRWRRPKLLPLLHKKKKSHLSSFSLAFSVSLYTVFFFFTCFTLYYTHGTGYKKYPSSLRLTKALSTLLSLWTLA